MQVRCALAMLACAMGVQATAAEVVMKPSAGQVEALTWTARVLERYRYKSPGQVKPAGVPVLDAYLDALDPDRMVFTQEDVRELDIYRARLEKAGAPPDAEIPFAIFDWFRPRLAVLMQQAKSRLREPMAFDGAERQHRVRTSAPRPADEAELRRLWRLRVMDEYLSLLLAGRPEAEIAPTLERRYDAYRARIDAMTPADVFTLFMNAYVRSLDPDGAYVAPRVAGPKPAGLAGVGAVLQKVDDRIVVHSLAPAGAAARSGQLQVGDRIVAIAAQPDQPVTGVTGWQVDEVVALLRGAPGSSLVLEVQSSGTRPGTPRRRLTLQRDPGPLEEAAGVSTLTPSAVVTVKHGTGSYRVGVVGVPPMYEQAPGPGAGKQSAESAARYVAGQLQAMKEAKADAVLLDLRNNSGGMLAQALGLAGLFLPGAPVVQQLSFDGKLSVEKAPDARPAWEGPLALLVDRGTAAGAEIVAAALQDHGRALVLGDRSYGKSSIHTILSLDRFAKVRLGDLQMSVAQAFRLDGASFERSGVQPDILLPGAAHAGPALDRHDGFAAGTQTPTAFRKDGALAALLPALAARHEARVAKDALYQGMLARRAQVLEQRRKGEVSLNEAERRRVRDAQPEPDARTVQLEEGLQVVADLAELLRAVPRPASPSWY